MEILSAQFGKTATGKQITRYTLINQNKMKVDIINFGATITSIEAPDRNGHLDDVITGFDTIAEYEDNSPYFGAICGRTAGRIHNGQFTLDGQVYQLSQNNGPNNLHGGIVGFHKKVWSASVEGSVLKLQYVSADGEEGYPGQLTVHLTYQLNDANVLTLDYTATTTKPTPVNLTNHAYFNLAGHKHGNILDHTMMVNSTTFTAKTSTDEFGVANGKIASVIGTKYDMREPALLRNLVDDFPADCCYCLPGVRTLGARVEDAVSGRVLEVYTDQYGLQTYTAWLLKDQPGKDGVVYQKHSSFCLEAQNYPNAVNHPNFPNSILRPGETYRQTTSYKFSTKQ